MIFKSIFHWIYFQLLHLFMRNFLSHIISEHSQKFKHFPTATHQQWDEELRAVQRAARQALIHCISIHTTTEALNLKLIPCRNNRKMMHLLFQLKYINHRAQLGQIQMITLIWNGHLLPQSDDRSSYRIYSNWLHSTIPNPILWTNHTRWNIIHNIIIYCKCIFYHELLYMENNRSISIYYQSNFKCKTWG